jgi:exopolysaccharide production protein ExoY
MPMNSGHAQKNARATKGGSLPRSSRAGIFLRSAKAIFAGGDSRETKNPAAHLNGAPARNDAILPEGRLPFFRDLILDLFRRERNASRPPAEKQGSALVPPTCDPVESIPDETFVSGAEPVRNPEIPRWKRALDLTFIALTAPFWLPLMGWIAVALKIASPGPTFYYQNRIGKDGKIFAIWKFRTMKVSAETHCHESYFAHLMRADCPMTKLDAEGDSRLVPMGRMLRASGLDELPQLFNVLRGEMSVVGPRPCLPNEFERYEPGQRRRVNAQPGLTGYWQVNGKNKTTFSQMIAMDMFYSKHMSLALDLKIILKTGPVLIGQFLEFRRALKRDRQRAYPDRGTNLVRASERSTEKI